MKLVIGLGNPGSNYENTRHNMGWMAIDRFAKKNNVEMHLEPKFQGIIGNITINGEKTILLKPVTYMNLSGESVIKVMTFYKIDPSDILVISDDLDSPLGRIRLRAKGSAGGHNGHKNIALHIKTEEYKRIKLGIDRSNVIPVIDWVLKKLSKDELNELDPVFDKVSDAIYDFASGIDFMRISSKYSEK
jgi:PTH1 family peptidyl-tRNA hydrolase